MTQTLPAHVHPSLAFADGPKVALPDGKIFDLEWLSRVLIATMIEIDPNHTVNQGERLRRQLLAAVHDLLAPLCEHDPSLPVIAVCCTTQWTQDGKARLVDVLALEIEGAVWYVPHQYSSQAFEAYIEKRLQLPSSEDVSHTWQRGGAVLDHLYGARGSNHLKEAEILARHIVPFLSYSQARSLLKTSAGSTLSKPMVGRL